jgi:hypothetical protein
MVIWLSTPTVLNLASGRQLMNYSYDPLDLVNTYGAFGTVGRERDEIIFEGTDDELITGSATVSANAAAFAFSIHALFI